MARVVNKLTAAKVSKVRKAGYHADGSGLYLQVKSTGSKSWLFRYMFAGTPQWMGLGPVNDVSLLEARQKAQSCRELLRAKLDPIKEREKQSAVIRAQSAGEVTFDDCAKAYITAYAPGWRNPKHVQQWENTLATYASPVIGKLPAQAIDTPHILKILEPIWSKKPETASRLRGRIESILDWSKARKYRSGENPARWRGHLDKLLPRLPKSKRTKHHPALPYSEIPEFVKELRELDGTAPRALEAVLLTACRVSEAVGARWPELDLKARIWTIPGERTKSGREHRVPLTDDAVKVFKAMLAFKLNDFVFPGRSGNKPLTSAACLKLVREMGYRVTVHGFRSSFRDWAAECTSYSRELQEAALAHVVGDQTERAYQRGDMLRKRALMMGAWSQYCGRTKSAKVTQIGSKRKAS